MVMNDETIDEVLETVTRNLDEAKYSEAAQNMLEIAQTQLSNDHWRKVGRILGYFPPEMRNANKDLLYIEGHWFLSTHQYPDAIRSFGKAKLLYGVNDAEMALKCCLALVRLYHLQEDFRTAHHQIEEAEALLHNSDDDFIRARYFSRLAELAPDIGQLSKSQEYARESLAIYRFHADIEGQFNSLMQLAITSRQMGNFPDAGSYLRLAEHCFNTGSVNSRLFARILNAKAHLHWYRGEFEAAARHAIELEAFADEHNLRNQRVFARLLLGNIHRASGEYGAAKAIYDKARELAIQTGYESFTQWIDIHEAWLKALNRELSQARTLIQAAQQTTDPGQMASFNIFLAVLNILESQAKAAEDLLLYSLDFYENSGDALSVHVIKLYLALVYKKVGREIKALNYLEQALLWLFQQNIDYFPHWWHPGLVSEVSVYAISTGIYPDLAERMLVNRVGQASLSPLQELLAHKNEAIVQRAQRVVRLIDKGQAPAILKKLAASPAKKIIEELVTTGYLNSDNLDDLAAFLGTGKRGTRINASIIAVFALYLQDKRRDEISNALGLAESTVRNYITFIYRQFDLPLTDYPDPQERQIQLRNLAVGKGFIRQGQLT